MKTGALILVAFVAIAGCTAPPVPDSGAGVGFNDYGDFELERARREAALSGAPVGGPLTATRVPQTTVGPNPNPQVIPSSDLAAAGIGTGATAAADPVTSGGLGNATTTPPAGEIGEADFAPIGETAEQRERRLANNPEISDEQNFDAVASRETIESDAERRQQQAQNLIVVDPVPLPAERANSGPNIVQYAINAPNQKGQQWYSRSILSGDNRFQRNCATYGSPDAAQRDFLTRGGPERDPRGIDPDGDGFACGWDPAPFRLAAGN